MIDFTAYCTPQPQGSSRAFVIKGKARITSANAKLKPYRENVRTHAGQAVWDTGFWSSFHGDPYFAKHLPVRLTVEFTFRKPYSVKNRLQPVVKPDLDKLVRATGDALTGVIYHDDAQVVEITARKLYGAVESVRVIAEEVI